MGSRGGWRWIAMLYATSQVLAYVCVRGWAGHCHEQASSFSTVQTCLYAWHLPATCTSPAGNPAPVPACAAAVLRAAACERAAWADHCRERSARDAELRGHRQMHGLRALHTGGRFLPFFLLLFLDMLLDLPADTCHQPSVASSALPAACKEFSQRTCAPHFATALCRASQYTRCA